MSGFLTRRKGANLTQEEVAQQIGLDRSTVAKWESGEAYPRAEKLPQIAQLYGCTIDDLFRADDGASAGEIPAEPEITFSVQKGGQEG